MSAAPHKDDVTGTDTPGHEWDGLRELDTPLPRWWLIIWYACIAIAVVYWVLMPAWPTPTGGTRGTLNYSDRVQVEKDLAALHKLRGAGAAALTNASLADIEKTPQLQSYAVALGQTVFGDNCAPCHGSGGTGGKGYPNLRDDVWLWGGSLEQIQQTITHGVRSGDPLAHMSQMPAFGKDGLLKPAQIDDLTEYVVSLGGNQAKAGGPAKQDAVERAAPIYKDQCSTCHGLDGKGNQALGAPNLTDKDWLYGADRASIHDQIWYGRGGVMPNWGARLSPETIKALTVYIHVNSGGGQ